MTATNVISPEFIKEYIEEFNYRYIKQFFINQLTDKYQRDIHAISEKLEEYKKTYPSPTFEEEEYLKIVHDFEKTSDKLEKVLLCNKPITHDEILGYIETLRHRYGDSSLLGPFSDYLKELKHNGNCIDHEIVEGVLEIKRIDDEHVFHMATEVHKLFEGKSFLSQEKYDSQSKEENQYSQQDKEETQPRKKSQSEDEDMEKGYDVVD